MCGTQCGCEADQATNDVDFNAVELNEEQFKKALIQFNYNFNFRGYIFRNSIMQKYEEIRNKSQQQKYTSYRIREIIVKEGNDLKQEELASKLMQKINKIFEKHNVNLSFKVCNVYVHNNKYGYITFISNTVSLDYIKEKFVVNEKPLSTKKIYELLFNENEQKSQENFLKSLVT